MGFSKKSGGMRVHARVWPQTQANSQRTCCPTQSVCTHLEWIFAHIALRRLRLLWRCRHGADLVHQVAQQARARRARTAFRRLALFRHARKIAISAARGSRRPESWDEVDVLPPGHQDSRTRVCDGDRAGIALKFALKFRGTRSPTRSPSRKTKNWKRPGPSLENKSQQTAGRAGWGSRK